MRNRLFYPFIVFFFLLKLKSKNEFQFSANHGLEAMRYLPENHGGKFTDAGAGYVSFIRNTQEFKKLGINVISCELPLDEN